MSVRANSVAVSLWSWVAPQREKSSRSAFGSRGPRCRLRSSLGALVFPLCPTRLAASKSQARPVAHALFLETQICSAWNEETSSIPVALCLCASVPLWRFSSSAEEFVVTNQGPLPREHRLLSVIKDPGD